MCQWPYYNALVLFSENWLLFVVFGAVITILNMCMMKVYIISGYMMYIKCNVRGQHEDIKSLPQLTLLQR